MTTTNETETTTSSHSPTHIAYAAREREGRTPVWNRVGVAWAHKNGKGGFNIQLFATPVDGKLSLFIATEKKD